uniref:V-type proton ATPase subunit a, vacuolar isoform n=1 Tax=Lygus hesperus TaxID=30085 RepID=A0A0A9WNL4_LYGHE
MTNFFLAPGTVTLPLFHGQAQLQVFLLLIAAICVPTMLCVIPYMEKKEHDAKLKAKKTRLLPSSMPASAFDPASIFTAANNKSDDNVAFNVVHSANSSIVHRQRLDNSNHATNAVSNSKNKSYSQV